MDRIAKLKELLVSSPHDCFLLHALGLEYVKISEIEKALEAFEKVIATNEMYVGTYYHLAKTYEKQNNIGKAIEVYRKGIDMATQLKDQHAKNELVMALDDLID